MIKRIKLWRMGKKAVKEYNALPNNWKCVNCGYEGKCIETKMCFHCPECKSIDLRRITE